MFRLSLLGLLACAPSLGVNVDTFDRARFAELMSAELELDAHQSPLHVQPQIGAMCVPNAGVVAADALTDLTRMPTGVEIASPNELTLAELDHPVDRLPESLGPLCLDDECGQRLLIAVSEGELQLVVESYRVQSHYHSTGMICPGSTHYTYELEESEPASRRIRRAAARALDRL